MTRYETSKILKILIIVLAVSGLVFYAVFNSRIFIAGPQISIESPANGENFIDEQLIQIKGSASNIAFIRLNGRQISVNEEGFFDESLLLSSGYNIIWITAEDRFGREEKEQLELTYSGTEAEYEIEATEELTSPATSSATSTQEKDLEEI